MSCTSTMIVDFGVMVSVFTSKNHIKENKRNMKYSKFTYLLIIIIISSCSGNTLKTKDVKSKTYRAKSFIESNSEMTVEDLKYFVMLSAKYNMPIPKIGNRYNLHPYGQRLYLFDGNNGRVFA